MRVPLCRRDGVVTHQILNAAQRNAFQREPTPERVPQRVNRHVLAWFGVMEPGRFDKIRKWALQGPDVSLPMTAGGSLKNEIGLRAFSLLERNQRDQRLAVEADVPVGGEFRKCCEFLSFFRLIPS